MRFFNRILLTASSKRVSRRGKPAWQVEKEAKSAEQKKKRGKSGKQKKMREKYADQDEEEREIAMALLGSAGNPKKNTKRFQRHERKDTKTAMRGQKKPKDEKRQNAFQRAEEELPPPAELKNENLGKVVENPESEEEDVEKLLEEEGFMSDVGLLDSLTGKPTESDIVHFAVPVVAPLSAVRDYKVCIFDLYTQTCIITKMYYLVQNALIFTLYD